MPKNQLNTLDIMHLYLDFIACLVFEAQNTIDIHLKNIIICLQAD